MTIWKGISLDHWAQHQTMNPPKGRGMQMYSGYEELRIVPAWDDYIPVIPLKVRFANFVERLNKALSR
jgi:hypothetical protein